MINSNIKKLTFEVLEICIAFIFILNMYNIKKNNEKKSNSSINNAAEESYKYWKKHYLVKVNSNMIRVINPEDNNSTVSEGIGYGMLFTVSYGDSNEFKELFAYAKKYFDKNGLMNWKIDYYGKVIGYGSASDADEDMVYALLLASKKWNNHEYLKEALKMMDSIKEHEISDSYILLPGDSWGEKPPINPSYIAPKYYVEFSKANVAEKEYWNNVFKANVKILSGNYNKNTGFLPNWINKSEEDTDFGYDAIRVPIRLMQFNKSLNNPEIKAILEREYSFISNKGANNLVSGYKQNGNPKVAYINTAYLSSFSAISFTHPQSTINNIMIEKLINSKEHNYYGDSLKIWVLFLLSGKL